MANVTPNPFRYGGQSGYQTDGGALGATSVNLLPLYLRARYYDIALGRFVSRDPIGFAGGDWNLYRYVRGNPVNGVDPGGLDWKDDLLYWLSWVPGFQTIISAITPAPGSNILDYASCKVTNEQCCDKQMLDMYIQQCHQCVFGSSLSYYGQTFLNGVAYSGIEALATAIAAQIAKSLIQKSILGLFGGGLAIADLVIAGWNIVQIKNAASAADSEYCRCP